MKNNVMHTRVQIDDSLLKSLLTTEVKETLATDLVIPRQSKRTFGVADLWKIRRNAKKSTTVLREKMKG